MAGNATDCIVLDTNCLVSGFLFPQSAPGQALDLVLDKYRLLMSIEAAAELTDVMRRGKFDQFLTRESREELVANTIRESRFIETSTTITECRDPKDNKFLELATDGRSALW
jgi:putative PIN family toxin of toxin-antitoxin system